MNPPTVGILRGSAAILFMNFLGVVPWVLGKFIPLGMLLLLGLNALEYSGGLTIAYGFRWLKPSFWAGETAFLPALSRRAWTLLPSLLAGIGGSVYAHAMLAPGAARPDAWLAIFVSAVGSLVLLVILWSMARSKLAEHKAAFVAALFVALSSAVRLNFPAWHIPEVLLNDLALAGGQFLLSLALLQMSRNLRGGLGVLFIYLALQITLSSVFAVFWVRYGALVQQFSVLACAALLLWREKRVDPPSVSA